MRIAYRASQFLRSFAAQARSLDRKEALGLLSPELAALFKAMPAAEQAHALAVMETLRGQGAAHPDLLAAALLHDVGKADFHLKPWERALVVLAGALAPELALRWSQGRPTGWRRAFVVARQHATWGAAKVRQASGGELLARLIERHHEPLALEKCTRVEDRLLAALKAADALN